MKLEHFGIKNKDLNKDSFKLQLKYLNKINNTNILMKKLDNYVKVYNTIKENVLLETTEFDNNSYKRMIGILIYLFVQVRPQRLFSTL